MVSLKKKLVHFRQCSGGWFPEKWCRSTTGADFVDVNKYGFWLRQDDTTITHIGLDNSGSYDLYLTVLWLGPAVISHEKQCTPVFIPSVNCALVKSIPAIHAQYSVLTHLTSTIMSGHTKLYYSVLLQYCVINNAPKLMYCTGLMYYPIIPPLKWYMIYQSQGYGR